MIITTKQLQNELFSNLSHLNKYTNFNKVYRASRDGRSVEEFHERCEEKGPTLTLITLADDTIVGGFASKNLKPFVIKINHSN